MVIASTMLCGSPSRMRRSLKVPGSPSSALHTMYFSSLCSFATMPHFSPVGNPAPPRPWSLLSVRTWITSPGCIARAFARAPYPSRAMYSSILCGSMRPAFLRTIFCWLFPDSFSTSRLDEREVNREARDHASFQEVFCDDLFHVRRLHATVVDVIREDSQNDTLVIDTKSASLDHRYLTAQVVLANHLLENVLDFKSTLEDRVGINGNDNLCREQLHCAPPARFAARILGRSPDVRFP